MGGGGVCVHHSLKCNQKQKQPLVTNILYDIIHVPQQRGLICSFKDMCTGAQFTIDSALFPHQRTRY